MLRRFLIVSMLLSAVATASAQEPVGDVAIPAAWSRANPGPTAAVYLEPHNDGVAPDRLRGAASPTTERIEIHAERNEGAIMSMATMPDLALPRGAAVTLAPIRLHLMLFGVRRPLKPGDRFALTLRLERAGAATVEVEVEGAGVISPPS